MTRTIKAYFCSWSDPQHGTYALQPGAVVTRPAGLVVAGLLDRALLSGRAWPPFLYEVEVDIADVRASMESLLRVSRLRVIRTVPLEEAFGPCAKEVSAIHEELPRVPWLAPSAPPESALVDDLVRRFYVGLAYYAPVVPRRARIVSRWEDFATPGAWPDPAAGEAAALGAIERQTRRVRGREVAQQAVGRGPYGLAYAAIWCACWQRAAAAYVGDWVPGGAKDPELTDGELHGALAAARERCGPVAGALAQLFLEAPATGKEHDRLMQYIRGALQRGSGSAFQGVWKEAWNAALEPVLVLRDLLYHLVLLPEEPNPWLPLFDLYRLGFWPVGVLRDEYLVYAPSLAAQEGAAPSASPTGRGRQPGEALLTPRQHP
jgi:hypothetical protein